MFLKHCKNCEHTLKEFKKYCPNCSSLLQPDIFKIEDKEIVYKKIITAGEVAVGENNTATPIYKRRVFSKY